MRFPGAAGSAGSVALVQEFGQVLQAEIEDIQLGFAAGELRATWA